MNKVLLQIHLNDKKPIKVIFQVHRNLEDCHQPRYVAKQDNRVVADGRTPNEVKECVLKKIGDWTKKWVEPEFIVMEE